MSSVPRTPPLAGDKPQPYIFLAGAGTPRYENWVHWLMGGSGVVCATHPAPGGGQAPALHFSIDARASPAGSRAVTAHVRTNR